MFSFAPFAAMQIFFGLTERKHPPIDTNVTWARYFYAVDPLPCPKFSVSMRGSPAITKLFS
jgi:hypothetical protein